MMKSKTGMFLRIELLLVVVLLSVTMVPGRAEVSTPLPEEMEIIWAESDGLRYEIFTSTFRSGAWQAKAQLTDDNAENLHPSIDAAADGGKWAVWTAIESGRFEIKYAAFVNDAWAEAQTLPSGLSVNIKPSVIVAADNVPWVVWSGNNGDDDDIYCTRFVDGEWTEESMIHDDNNVPDVLPTIDVDDTGRPVVTWERFVDGSYVVVQSAWSDGVWGAVTEVEVKEGEEQSEALQVAVPAFITDTSQMFLRATSGSGK